MMETCIELNKNDRTTHNIAKKGFRGMRRVVARFNFSCNLIGNLTQSLSGHIVNVMGKFKKRLSTMTQTREPPIFDSS
jgi:hypothetical protein